MRVTLRGLVQCLVSATTLLAGCANDVTLDTASIKPSAEAVTSQFVPGVPKGYFNGSFVITTNGPTPISALQVSRIEANGYPIPSNVLTMGFRGQSALGYALQAASQYNVSTAEIHDGVVILH